MEDESEFAVIERERFQQCYRRLIALSHQDDNQSKTNFNLLLDELNSMEYQMKIVREEEANRLISKLLRLTPLYEERLLVKVCHVINNFTAKQQLNLMDQTLAPVTEYLISALQRCQPWTLSDILQALGAVLYENCGRLVKYHHILLGRHQGVLLPLITGETKDEDLLRGAVQCVQNLTIKVAGQTYLEDQHTLLCFEIFMNLLHDVPTRKLEPNTQCKILVCALRGLQNILTSTKIMPSDQLGPLLAGVRAYMFHGISSFPVAVPETLCPTPLSHYDVNPTSNSVQSSEPKEEDNTKGGPVKPQPGKKTRKKKSKKTPDKGGANESDKTTDQVDVQSEAIASLNLDVSSSSLRPAWAKISSSDSEYSDTEGGQNSRLRSHCTKVRQCALSCLLTVIKNTDRRLMFGYWSSFIPDSSATGNSPQVQTLFTIILKDPSPKCRMGGLAALTALVDGTKAFLAAAEDSDEVRTAFMPFSTILGATIRELHRCLLLALVSENYPLTLTQLIKCLAILVGNVPYPRMKPGLLSRVVKQVRNFLSHRDPNVRVACLTCFGAVAAIQPPLMEVCHIIQPSRPPQSARAVTVEADMDPRSQGASNSDSGFTSNNSDDSLTQSDFGAKSSHFQGQSVKVQGQSPGVLTPPVGTLSSSSGVLTPVFTDQLLQAHVRETSWLIKLCLKNILPYPDQHGGVDDVKFEPLPVRLESLQVLAHLTKGYFPIIRNSTVILRDLISRCIQDTDPVVRLHTSKLMDELTQAVLQDVQAPDHKSSAERISLDQAKDFWFHMLEGPLPRILQTERHSAVKATGCDCISNIGPEVFAILPFDKRILCITLVLGLTSDDDRVVRSAAVRAVGVYVLYPCLREDVSFVADSANAILKCMEDSSLNVRLKTAWSLANLCDALVHNKTEGDTDFLEDFSDMLLQKLFTVATKACTDSDKVKSNAVRALGNLMRYLPCRSLEKCTFRIPIEDGIKALVKNINTGTMKVRWNACYAVSNLFKNPLLNHGSTGWTKDIVESLCNVVRDCKNFKVRINAAVALTSPLDRGQYGTQENFYSVWNSLLVGLQTAEDITDFTDFKYKNNLNSQICTCILHLVVMTTQSDLKSISQLLDGKYEVISSSFEAYRNSPEEKKAETEQDVDLARKNLMTMDTESLTKDERRTLVLLKQLCSPPSYEENEEKEKAVSNFKQIYD